MALLREEAVTELITGCVFSVEPDSEAAVVVEN